MLISFFFAVEQQINLQFTAKILLKLAFRICPKVFNQLNIKCLLDKLRNSKFIKLVFS